MPIIALDIIGPILSGDEATQRETCSRQGIHYCEPGSPFEGSGPAYHPLAAEVPEPTERLESGRVAQFHCPACGKDWWIKR